MPVFDSARPLVFAHRGGCALGPENTVRAFDRGIATGADGLELDVHLSADGVVVVHHDETLDRTTNATGPIAARTAAELGRIDAGEGEAIPVLADLLHRYPETPIIIEMKVNSAAMGEAVARVVRESGAAARICLAGFGSRSVRAGRARLPGSASSASLSEVRTMLYRSWIGWSAKSLPYGAVQVPETAQGHRVVSPRFIRHAHASGVKVQVWTVDDESDMRRLLDWGVDALISNRPDLAVRVRNERFP
ncbi:MAG: glycerophosphodiester phosphodiesterase [Acidobacteria bacterium]|nr:glycerophosphodiester phosphodiesterase [Acidobacteriota bacterium]